MGSRGVFDQGPQAPGPIAVISDAPELVLVDKVLGTSYDVVKEVVGHLDQIEELNQSIWNIHHIIPIIDEITVSGIKGVGGSGTLIENPKLYLDLSTLPIHTGATTPDYDMLAIYDWSAQETRSIKLSAFKGTIIDDVTTSVGLVQTNLDNLGASVNLDLVNFRGQLLSELDALLAQTRETIQFLDAKVIELNALSNATLDQVFTDIASVNTTIGELNDLKTTLASDVDVILANVSDLMGIAGTLESELEWMGVTLEGKASAEGLSALDFRITETETGVVAQATRIDSLRVDVDGKADSYAMNLLTSRVIETEGTYIAQAGAITQLNSNIEGKASSSALDALTTRVSDTEGTIDAHTSQITSLSAAVGDTSLATAVTSLDARVTVSEDLIEIHSSEITTLTSAVVGKASITALTALDTRLTVTDNKTIAQATQITDLLVDLDGKATNESMIAVMSRITETEGDIVAQQTALTNLTSTVGTKASATGLTALDIRVTATEELTESHSFDITSLTNTINNIGETTAISELSSRVTETEEMIEAQAFDITSLTTTVNGKADGSVVDLLTSRVTVTEGLIDVQQADLTTMQSSIEGKASSTALSGLETRVTSTENSITSQGVAITNLTNSLPGKADATAVTGLISRVTQTENDISTQSTNITNLTNTIANKADASAVSALDIRVYATEQMNISQASDLTALATNVGTRATSEAVTALSSRVTETEQDILAQATDITTLNTNVGTKASSTALQELDLRVFTAEGTIASTATALTALATGSMEYKLRWDFLTTVSGWGGAGIPTWVTGGMLRPANHATDAYIISPNISLNGGLYNRVQIRIKKVGTPTWAGQFYWAAAGGGFGVGGRVLNFTQPTYDEDGWAIVTLALSWAETVTQIRFDLSTNQDATNYFLIDWIAVGRLNTNAVAALTAKSQEIGETVVSQAGSIIDLTTTVSGKATNQSVVDLGSRVTTTENVANSKAKVFRQASAPTATTVGDIWFDSDDNDKPYSWSGSAWVAVDDKRVPALEITTIAQGSSITTLNSVLQGYTGTGAVANAVLGVTTRVTATEGVANSKAKVFRQASAPTATTIGDIWFDSDDSHKPYTWSGSAWVLVEDGRIPGLRTDVNAHTQSINSIGIALDTKASVTATDNLSAEIDVVDGKVSAIATAITEITAGATPGDIASARFKMQVESTPAGWSSRFGIRVKGGVGDTFSQAGIFFDVNSATSVGRVVVTADKFVIQDGSVYGAPFIVSGGFVRMNNVKIDGGLIVDGTMNASKIEAGSITTDRMSANTINGNRILAGSLNASKIEADSIEADRIKSYNLTSANATFGNVNISNANIGTLLVGGENIRAGAIAAGGSAAGTKVIAPRTTALISKNVQLFKKNITYTNRSGGAEFIRVSGKLIANIGIISDPDSFGSTGKATVTVVFYIKQGNKPKTELASYTVAAPKGKKGTKVVLKIREVLIAPQGIRGAESVISAEYTIIGKAGMTPSNAPIPWSASCEASAIAAYSKA